jgi:exodeoxyribonuclease-3
VPTTVATWNVNSLRVRLPQMADWLARNPVDILALQETKITDEEFPSPAIAALGYEASFSGEKTYNGVAILTRMASSAAAHQDLLRAIPGFPDPQKRVLAATVGPLRVVNLYVPNGQAVGSEKFAYKLRWLEALRPWLREEASRCARLLVLGDFNVAPEDRDVHDPAAWQGQNLVSAPERAALAAIVADGFIDVFRRFEQPEKSFSWWDYRMGAFRRNHGLRIDLILAHSTLGRLCTACHIDREPRTRERPSDHAPVLATFDI